MDHCNRRLDKKKASEMTVKVFQMTLNGNFLITKRNISKSLNFTEFSQLFILHFAFFQGTEAQREFKSLFASFKSAWRVVCDSLDKQGQQ